MQRARWYRGRVTRVELHDLVDQLPEESLEPGGVLLRRAQDPVVATLDAAPCDDEEFPDDRRAVHGALSAPAVPWSQADAELRAG